VASEWSNFLSRMARVNWCGSSSMGTQWREFLAVVVMASGSAGVASASLGAGSSLRRAIPRDFVQDDLVGPRLGLFQASPSDVHTLLGRNRPRPPC
jgi:hypothetical protein